MLLEGIKTPLWIYRGLEAAIEEHYDLSRNPLQCFLTQLFTLG